MTKREKSVKLYITHEGLFSLLEEYMENILIRIKEMKRLSLSLRIYSHAVTALSVLMLLYAEYLAYKSSPLDALLLAVSLAVPFFIVSALRIIIDAPRPYELYGIYENLPKHKSGHSFPSRHAFSAFAIGVCALPLAALPAIILLVLSIGMCVARVLLGIHFVRDVAAGAAIGIISAIIGIILL